MSSKQLVVALASATLICLWQSAVGSEGSTVPANWLNTPGVQAGSSGDQPQKDCCVDVQHLKEEIRRLQNRLTQLENKLNRDNVTFASGNSKITINQSGISITSSNISIKATGAVVIKGSKVTQN